MRSFLITAGSQLLLAAWGLSESLPDLPIVDLGYALHKASSFNSTGNYFTFSNIRYAAPPIGELRFAAPIPPENNRSAGVQDGSYGPMCPQSALPVWEQVSRAFITSLSKGNTNFTPPAVNFTVPTPDPRESEDCLFLDVLVSKDILKKAGNGTGGAPALVWIHGGAYVVGEKNLYGNPAGLLRQSGPDSISGSSPEVIYIALNYRLGAFGWLAGPTLQSNGSANVGLLDQRLALEWVQKYIHLFGGDPKRVTVFGESAGGGSIMHQITAYGGIQGDGVVPFQQAIMQSPGFLPLPSLFQQEESFNGFLKFLGVNTIEEARKLPTKDLALASSLMVINATYGTYTWGPVVDGTFVPALPGKLLLQGAFDHSVRVMGLFFTDPSITNDAKFTTYFQVHFPSARPEVLQFIQTTLYPPIFDGSFGYTNPTERLLVAIAEFAFTCNTNFFDRALDNKTFAYMFSVPPALHGQDVPYTFYNGDGKPTDSVVNATVAFALQKYITDFAKTGNPDGPGLPHFPLYGDKSTVVSLNATTISETRDPVSNLRCEWWQKALYF
ncbi:hypothetical protein FGG08_003854 [Glutinoglossum americanum]|uniref:Carboxylic ester hydrolase n=1 Tax=Glutinoglossum americanum TaxID=1670608 RepID=A0A9P8L398_9PEZI|nr:hypothetical protein FGG08_003854 [Glutinoglossum americanum]